MSEDIKNPLDGHSPELIEAADARDFLVAYGWMDEDGELNPPHLMKALDLMWDVCIAVGKMKGMVEVDSLTKKRISDLSKSFAELQDSNNKQIAENSRLQGEEQERRGEIEGLEAQLRQAAQGLREQREELASVRGVATKRELEDKEKIDILTKQVGLMEEAQERNAELVRKLPINRLASGLWAANKWIDKHYGPA